MGREPPINDERAPRRVPNTRKVRREPGSAITAMVRDTGETRGPHLTTRVGTRPTEGAIKAALLAVGPPVVRARTAVRTRPAPYAAFRSRVGARAGELVVEGVPSAVPSVAERGVVVPAASKTRVAPDRQAGVRAVMEMEQVAHVLGGEAVLAAAPRSEEAPCGAKPVGGPAARGAQVTPSALPYEPTSAPVVARPGRPGDT